MMCHCSAVLYVLCYTFFSGSFFLEWVGSPCTTISALNMELLSIPHSPQMAGTFANAMRMCFTLGVANAFRQKERKVVFKYVILTRECEDLTAQPRVITLPERSLGDKVAKWG